MAFMAMRVRMGRRLSSQLGVRLIHVNEVRYKFLSIYKTISCTNMLPVKGKQKISADNLMLAFLMDPYLVINFR